MSTSYIQYPSAGSTLTFIDSLVNNSGIISLVGDTATPGNNAYYGTNGVGTLGFYSLSAGYANVNLSNLVSPTAVNVNLNMDSGTVITLDTGSVAAPSINFGTSFTSPWGMYGVYDIEGDHGIGLVQGGTEFIRFWQDGAAAYVADGQHPTTCNIEFIYAEGGRMTLNANTQIELNVNAGSSRFYVTASNCEVTLPLLADAGISLTGSNPTACAAIDARGTNNQGILLPQVSTTVAGGPVKGLIVFDTNNTYGLGSNVFIGYNGSAWVAL